MTCSRPHAHPRPAKLDRRGVLGLVAAATGGLAAAPASAFRMDSFTLPNALAPAAKDALDWSVLLQGQWVMPPALSALDGKTVSVNGYPMAIDQPEGTLLLAAYLAHCPVCIPGGSAALISVLPEDRLDIQPGHPIALRGTFRLLDRDTGLLYGLDAARPI